jgi:hypothetical protein
LKPCFDKEQEKLGFTGDEKFSIIDIYTEESYDKQSGYQHNTANRVKRQLVRNNDLDDLNQVSVIYELPESRQKLIDYLDNPNIPERQCFNNSAYLDGKDLFRLLCLESEHNHGSSGYSKPKTFSQCAYAIKEEPTATIDTSSIFTPSFTQTTTVLRPHYPTPARKPKGLLATLFAPIARLLGISEDRKTSQTEKSKHKRSAELPGDNSIQYTPAPVYKAVKVPEPPVPEYGLRKRRRYAVDCNENYRYRALCEELKSQNKTVDCGKTRFSKCDSEWRDCVQADEEYLRGKTDYYLNNFADQCPAYDPNSTDDPYPGQPVQAKRQKYPDSLLNSYQYANRRQETQCVSKGDGQCRVQGTTGGGEKGICEHTCTVAKAPIKELTPIARTDLCEESRNAIGCSFP